MHTIHEFTGSQNLPDLIRRCVVIGVKGTSDEIRNELPDRVEAVLLAAEKCRDAAGKASKAFDRMSGLAKELVLACTNQVCAFKSLRADFA
jgi:hypothetical protein